MALKAAIFDFGGVFMTSPVSNFAIYEKAHGLPHRFISEVIRANLQDGAFARWERAELTLDEFDRAFAAETRAAGHEVPGSALVGLMRGDFRPDMVAALDAINEAGLKTGLITNNTRDAGANEFARSEEDRALIAEIFARFDHVIESAKAGVRKPEPRIYEMMCEALGVAPEEAVFIDDLGVNLKPAAAMGMATVKVPFDNYQTAIRELAALTGLNLAA